MDIRFDDRVELRLVDFEELLEKKIKKVAQRINIDISNAKWIIYDANNFDDGKCKKESALDFLFANNKITKMMPQLKKCKYPWGFFNHKTGEIGISYQSIMRSAFDIPTEWQKFLPVKEKMKFDFLARVIIDELTHYLTGKGHDQPDYDKVFMQHMEMYFL